MWDVWPGRVWSPVANPGPPGLPNSLPAKKANPRPPHKQGGGIMSVAATWIFHNEAGIEIGCHLFGYAVNI
jgi:hypothetical protein